MTFTKIRRRTASVINLTGVFEKADESILPAMYNYISKDLNASPSEMGAITVCRALTQALTSPIGGILGSISDRMYVILYGCLIWATMTWLFGVSRWAHHPYVLGAIVWAFNGLGLSLVIPNSQSIIADYYPSESRGKAFGLLMLTGSIGAVIGSLFATNLASFNTHAIRGWQLVMFVLSIFSALIGLVNIRFGTDPRNPKLRHEIEGSTEEERQFLNDLKSDETDSESGDRSGKRSWADVGTSIKRVLQLPTFKIVILQGIVGSMPHKALMTFFTLYMQLIGMSDFQASFLFSLFLIGCAFGFWLGGFLGDRAAIYSPNHGRIFVTQIGVFSGIPMMAIIFKGLPRNSSVEATIIYGVVLVITGILIQWAAPACNNPVFAEIVPARDRNIIYSFDRCLEDALASPTSFLVGLAAEKIWGFEGDASSSDDTEMDLEKAEALSQALMWFTVVPWTLCVIFYTGLHFTYKKDKRKALGDTIE